MRPEHPTSVDIVTVAVVSDIGISGESHSVFGNVVRVFIHEDAHATLRPPPFDKTLSADIGTLPPGDYVVEVNFVHGSGPPRTHTRSLSVAKAAGGLITGLDVLPKPALSQQTLSFVLSGLSGCGDDYSVNAWTDIVNGTQIDVTYHVTVGPGNGCFVLPPPHFTTGRIGHFPAGEYTMIARGTVLGVRQAALKVAFTLPESPVGAVEYYRPGLDHYFVTADPAEIGKLDAHTFPAGWLRTDEGFGVTAPNQPASAAVCRFYGKPEAGLDTHFFSASPAECGVVQNQFAQAWVLESPNVFGVTLPNLVDGTCPSGLKPLYRLFNNRADVNHRYTVSAAVREDMLARRWRPEGYGNQGVAMCVY